MKRALLFPFLFVLVALAALAGCSAGSGPVMGLSGSSRSGVSSSQAINALSDYDRGRMCDWVAQENGGYGGSLPPVKCEKDFTVTKKAPKSQAECIEDLKKAPVTCDATVGEVEDCLTYLANNPCSTEKNPPACAGLLNDRCTKTTVTVVESPPPPTTSAPPQAD